MCNSYLFNNSEWIWKNDCKQNNIYVDFFDKFNFNGQKCELYLSVDAQYALYINNKFVDCGQYADYNEYKVYDKIDITDFVNQGNNTLKISAYWHGIDGFIYRLENPGVIFSVFSDNDFICFSSKNTLSRRNNAFKSDGVDFISSQLLFTFEYNSLLENTGELSLSDVQKKTKALYSRPIKKLDILPVKIGELCAKGVFFDTEIYPQIGMKMQRAAMSPLELEEIRPILPDKNGYSLESDIDCNGIYAIIDLGEEETGLLSLSFETDEECDVLIGYGEHLNDLRVRAYVGERNFCSLYHAHKGKNEFFYPFKRMGLRYLQINAYTKKIKLYYAGISPTHYPVSDIPYFKCKDHLHNKIYEISRHTLHMCMHEHYEDCPWREQGLYTMDSRTQMLCGYYAFGEFDFAKASLRLIALSLREDNMLEICSPCRFSKTIPSFTAVFPLMIYEYFLHSNDKEFISEILPTVKKICDGFVDRSDETGLIPNMDSNKYWNFYEWQDGYEGWVEDTSNETVYAAPLNAFVSIALSSISKIYLLLNNAEQAEYYRQKVYALNLSLNKYFFNDDEKIYYSYLKQGKQFHLGELTQALCVLSNACEDNKNEILKALAYGKTNMKKISLSHSIFKYEALMRDEKKYSAFVFEEIAKKWGEMVFKGATSFWETETGERAFGNAGSLCHGWSAVPVYFYFRYALGYKAETKTKETTYSGIPNCEGVLNLERI